MTPCLSVFYLLPPLRPALASAEADAAAPLAWTSTLLALPFFPALLALLAALALVAVALLSLRCRRLLRELALARIREARLSDMTAPLPGGLFQALHTPGGPPHFIYASEGVEKSFGLSIQELLRDPAALGLHPDDRQRFEAQWGYAAYPGSTLQFTGRMLHNGDQRWCAFVAQVGETPSGDLLVSGAMLDVTDRLRSEEALRENERRFRTLAENLPGAAYRCLLDEERTMLFISDGVQGLTGYPSSDFIGGLNKSLSEIIHPNDLERVTDSIATAVSRGESYTCDYRILKADGSVRWVYDKGQGIRGEQDPDDVLWLDGVMIDITAQKQAEDSLREAKNAADQANKAKGEFLARMSHEIRTPMNAVLGMCHLTLQTRLDAKQHDYLTKLQNAAKSLLGVINDILDFSKIEAGRMELEIVPFRPRAVLDNLRSLIALSAEEKGLDLRIQADDDVPRTLLGDPLRLGQVLTNLAVNAVKFTEAGFVEVRVALEWADTQNAVLFFSVTDSGIGLSQEQIGRLFQSFSQADGSITRKYGGSGLGLAICKRLVEMMEGHIDVQSAPGEGSTFSFSISFDLPQGLSDEEEVGAKEMNVESLRGARVLLAEDNEINRQIACEVLEQVGIIVRAAHDGHQALEMALAEEWDAVLMDVQMPELDGLEATRRLREKGFTTPIVAMTAHAMAEAREQCLEAGMDDHVSKPIDPEVLFRTLLAWIPSGPRQAPLPVPTPSPPHMPEPPEPQQAGDFPTLPEVDTIAGLKTLRGNARLYRQLLERFAQTQGDAATCLRGYIETGDTAQAEAIAHAVKGVAANLGALDLAETASAVETACKTSPLPRDIPVLVEDFGARLEKITSAIKNLPSPEPLHEQSAATTEELQKQITPLAHLLYESLDNDLAEAMRCLDNLRPHCVGPLAGPFTALEKDLTVFDTDMAKKHVKQLAKVASLNQEPSLEP